MGINIDDILKAGVRVGASDIHIGTGRHPIFRVEGKLMPVKNAPRLTADDVKSMAYSMMNPSQRERFEQLFEMDLAYSISGLSRFRVNIFQQRGTYSIAIRSIPFNILNFQSLHLPPVMEKIASEERGLIIVTGTTGSGKSTTLAALVDFINKNKARHIITVEDPLEYMHEDQTSYINQREVGIDTMAFANAMRAALREDPDVILVGELRDLETMEICLSAAETGHLVLTTLHTLDAMESVNRMLTVFPPHQHNQVRYQLAQVLKAIISQRLVPTADGKARVPAVEVLIATERIKDLISDPTKTWEIRQAIQEGSLHYGMQTFDQCLYNLYKGNLITYDEAMRQATNRNDLAMRIEGITSGSSSLVREETFGTQGSR
ncbi:MAG: type IV pilus twitching motility protein PilT [Candidatus Dadabacteria bacterium]|jgi:twitching motility protein PilT|nr:type IV pilus twitching motility protein PilT [Candidatus Dadabacteria bacterium]